MEPAPADITQNKKVKQLLIKAEPIFLVWPFSFLSEKSISTKRIFSGKASKNNEATFVVRTDTGFNLGGK